MYVGAACKHTGIVFAESEKQYMGFCMGQLHDLFCRMSRRASSTGRACRMPRCSKATLWRQPATHRNGMHTSHVGG